MFTADPEHSVARMNNEDWNLFANPATLNIGNNSSGIDILGYRRCLSGWHIAQRFSCVFRQRCWFSWETEEKTPPYERDVTIYRLCKMTCTTSSWCQQRNNTEPVVVAAQRGISYTSTASHTCMTTSNESKLAQSFKVTRRRRGWHVFRSCTSHKFNAL